MFKKSLVALSIFSAVFITGCGKERAVYDQENGYQPQSVTFSQPKLEHIQQLQYADKRGFDDYNCDGIEDMIGLKDRTNWYESQDYKGDFYEGYYNEEGLLHFQPASGQINLPFRVPKWVSQYKLDSVKLNNDECSDIVYSGFTDNYDGRFELKFAINDNDKKITDPLRMLPLETKFDNSEYYETGIGRTENIFIEFIHAMQVEVRYDDEEDSLYSYLKQDWCDVNGDGTDDFILLWNLYDDLSILVAYSSPYGETGYSQFVETESFYIKGFLEKRSVSSIDTEDYNGDGSCDIISYERWKNTLNVNIATFQKGQGFVPEMVSKLTIPEGLDIFASAQKFDTFDRNKDGKADLNYITEKDDKQVMITWFSK